MTNTITGIVTVSLGTAAQWAATTKVVPQGVLCFETDTKKSKIADGSSLYSALGYYTGGAAQLNVGNGVGNDGSGNLVVVAADTTITISSSGIKVNSTGISYPNLDHGSVSSGTVTLDRSVAAKHKLTVAGSLTIALANFPSSGNYTALQLELVNGGSATVTFPTINWKKTDGSGTFTTSFSATGVTLQTSGTDWITLWSEDGGVTVYGAVLR